MRTVVRWNPFWELAAIQNRLANNGWRDAQTCGTLALDVHEDGDAYTVIANLPGLDVDAIGIHLHDNVLTVEAEIVRSEMAEDARTLLNERIFGKFTRSITLPRDVAEAAVEADYQDGVLRITLPKAEEAKPHRIAVKAGEQLLPRAS